MTWLCSMAVVVVLPALVAWAIWAWQERANARQLEKIARRLRRERQHREVYRRLLAQMGREGRDSGGF